MRSEEDNQILRIREALASGVCDDVELKEFEICETDWSIYWRLLLRILQGGTVVCLYGGCDHHPFTRELRTLGLSETND